MERRIRLIIQGEDRASTVLAGAAGNATRHMSTIQRMGARLLTGFLAWKAIGAVGDMIGKVVGGIGDQLATTAAEGMEFNRTISAIGAIAQTSGQELDQLRTLANRLGKDTVFTSNEAAEAIKELAKAGIDTPTILNGAAEAAVNLAAAGELELAPAAEIMARALNSFNLGGDKAAWVADILTGAANTSATSVENVGAAMKFASSNMASLTNDSYTSEAAFVDLATAIAAMSNMGIDASMAGTGLSRILEGLTPNSEKAAAMMKDMGVSFFDAKGDFIGLKAALDVLHGGLSKLTDEEQATQIEKIFGVRGKNAVQALMRAIFDTSKDWDKYRDQVTEANLATDTAAKKLDNLAGSVEFLKGTVSSFRLEVWTQQVEEALRPAAERITEMFNKMITAAQAPEFKNAINSIATTLSTVLVNAIDIIEPKILGFMSALGKHETVESIDALGRSLSNLFAAVMGEKAPIEPGTGLYAIRGFTDYMGSDVPKTATGNTITLAGGIDILTGAVNRLATFIRDSKADFDYIKAWYEHPWDQIGAISWSGIFEKMKSEVSEFVTETKEGYRRAVDNANKFIDDNLASFDRWIVSLGATGTLFTMEIGRWLVEAGLKLATFDPQMYMVTWGAKLVSGWIAAGAEMLGQIVVWGAELYNAIASIDLTQAAYTVAVNVIAGLVNGISGGVGKVVGAITGVAISAIAGWAKATQTKSPSKVFTEFGENIVQGLLVGFENMTPELLQRVEDLANMVQTVFRTVSEGIPALDALKGYEAGLTRDNVLQFSNDVFGVVETLQAVVLKFSADGVKAAAEWATSANTVLGLISSGVDALVKLRDVTTRGLTRDMVLQFAYDVYGVVETIQAVTATFSADGVKAAAEWATSAGTIIGIIGSGIDAFVKLRDETTRGLMRESLVTFAENLATVVQIMEETTYLFTNEGVAAAAEFADGVGRVVAPLVGAIEAFNALREYKGVMPWMFDMLGADIRLAVDKMVDIASKFSVEGVEAAAVFADAVGRILAPIGAAIELFTSINDYKGVAPAAVKLLADDIMGTVGHIIALTKYADTEGAESAAKFADASGRIFDGMKSGIETIAAINDGNGLDAGKAADFFAGVTAILASAGQIAQQQGQNGGFTFVENFQTAMLEVQDDFIAFFSTFIDNVMTQGLEPGYELMKNQAYAQGANAGRAWSQGFEDNAVVKQTITSSSTSGSGGGGTTGGTGREFFSNSNTTVTVNLNGLSTAETVNRTRNAVSRSTGVQNLLSRNYGA